MRTYFCKLWRELPRAKAMAWATWIAMAMAPWSFAGGGPENVFLLVNSTSQDSKTLANHYLALRKIPASNVHYLEWDKEKPSIYGRAFRDEVLLPVLQEIKKRGLLSQIDYLVYSCDFPWKVNFASEFPGVKYTPGYQPHGSITGSTYLLAYVVDKRKEMFGLRTNYYYSAPKNGVTISRGFHSQYRWLPGGQRTDVRGLPYMLSAMLGVTQSHGNTVDEIIRYLQVASKADATHPKGTVYFLKHKGPRSTPRHGLFPEAVRELELAGVKAEIIEGRFPKGKQDIMGVTTGAIQFDLAKSGCRMLPGSFGDNLTSAGAQFAPRNSQTTLTEFLRHGAAGACGTVHEPLNYPQKFPTPFLHVHYAHGSSLAEAFYQSVQGPFQQLLVGDPLCQPWAHQPEVTVSLTSEADSTKRTFVSGTVTLTPLSVSKESRPIRFYELFVDGVRRKRSRPDGFFRLDTTQLADGYHELRVVAIDNTPLETQGRWIGNVNVKNGREAVQFSIQNQDQLVGAKHLVIKVASTQKKPVLLMHNHRELAEVSSGNGVTRIETKLLGSGPITLQAWVKGEPGLFSKPVHFVLP